MTRLDDIEPKTATLAKIFDPRDNSLLDKSILIYYAKPNSFTGEDTIEIFTHGGTAVIKDTLSALSQLQGFRIAEPGEFSKRAFLNGKMDLTEVEALADLIHSETSSQRSLALHQLEGSLSKAIQLWREEIKFCLAYVIAYIDFGDDAKIEDVHHMAIPKVEFLMRDIKKHISDDRGESIRDGYQITLIGAPNVGKSSLMNILSKKDVSIVSDIEGTTRDVIQVGMSLGGYSVIINDTAGLRESVDPIEREGIKRALNRAKESKLVVMLSDNESGFDQIERHDLQNVIRVVNKIDLRVGEKRDGIHYISCKSNEGIDELLAFIKDKVQNSLSPENILITRARHRQCFEKCYFHLQMFLETKNNYDIASEHLREAANWLGKVTGEIDLEEILDVVFKEFCIGK